MAILRENSLLISLLYTICVIITLVSLVKSQGIQESTTYSKKVDFHTSSLSPVGSTLFYGGYQFPHNFTALAGDKNSFNFTFSIQPDQKEETEDICEATLCFTTRIPLSITNEIKNWSNSCYQYFSVTSKDEILQKDILLPNAAIFASIFITAPFQDKKTIHCKGTMSLSGQVCTGDKVGENCETSIVLPNNEDASYGFTEDLLMRISPIAKKNFLNSIILTGSFTNSGAIIAIGDGFVPTQTNYTQKDLLDTNFTYTIKNPRFTYSTEQNTALQGGDFSTYIRFFSLSSQDVLKSFNIAPQFCTSGKTGPECLDNNIIFDMNNSYLYERDPQRSASVYGQLFNLSNQENLVIGFGSTAYITLSSVTKLFSSALSQAVIYLRLGGSPDLSTRAYDIEFPSSQVAFGYYNATVNTFIENNANSQLHFLIYWPKIVSLTTSDVGLWFNTNCPSSCSGHGVCPADNNQERIFDVHGCVCNSPYRGWTCDSKIDPKPSPTPDKHFWEEKWFLPFCGVVGAFILLLSIIIMCRCCNKNSSLHDDIFPIAQTTSDEFGGYLDNTNEFNNYQQNSFGDYGYSDNLLNQDDLASPSPRSKHSIGETSDTSNSNMYSRQLQGTF